MVEYKKVSVRKSNGQQYINFSRGTYREGVIIRCEEVDIPQVKDVSSVLKKKLKKGVRVL